MLRTLQRPIALILLPLSLFFSTGCTSVRIVPAVEAEPPTEDDIVGVTTLAGLGFEFDSAGMIRGDTVYATVEKRPMASTPETAPATSSRPSRTGEPSPAAWSGTTTGAGSAVFSTRGFGCHPERSEGGTTKLMAPSVRSG
jgi:hypothetical protein